MKGQQIVKVSMTREDMHGFTTTDTVTFEADYTYESLDHWVELFENILKCVGFYNVNLEVEEEDEEYI